MCCIKWGVQGVRTGLLESLHAVTLTDFGPVSSAYQQHGTGEAENYHTYIELALQKS